MLDELDVSLKQINISLYTLLIGAFVTAFAETDVLPNNSMSYLTMMNDIFFIGVIMITTAVVTLCEFNDDVNRESDGWLINRRHIIGLYWLEAVDVSFMYLITVIL